MPSILLVEDDKALRELFSMLLSLEGYEVNVAGDGQEAMQFVSQQTFDLIITDMMMPVMDGMKFLHWLKHEQQHNITPVMAITSMQDDIIEQQIRQAGADAVTFKPIDTTKFLADVKRFF